PEDAWPIEPLLAGIEANAKKELQDFKLEQTPRLTGTEPQNGAAYDRNEPSPPSPAVARLSAAVGDMAKARSIVESVLNEIGSPPVKPGRDDTAVHVELLPAFSEKTLEKYASDDKPKSKVREAVTQARAVLYAVNPKEPPSEIAAEVANVRKELHGVNLS